MTENRSAVGRRSRNKGKRGELELIAQLQPTVDKVYQRWGLEPPTLKRNLMQVYRQGADATGLEWLALEVKRAEQLNLNKWWDQAQRQALGHQIPVLVYRKNNAPWRVRMMGYLPDKLGEKRTSCLVDVSLDTFLVHFETLLEQHLYIFGLSKA